MLKITRTNTKHHTVFTVDSTRWSFAKGDYSKLQEVFELLYAYQCTGLEPQQVKEALLNLHTLRKSLESLESQKPTGTWIEVEEGYVCSECRDCFLDAYYMGEKVLEANKFCSKCGARMEGRKCD